MASPQPPPVQKSGFSKVKGETLTITISTLELWVLRLFGALVVSALLAICGIGWGMYNKVEKLNTTLEIVKPADILVAVHELERSTLTTEEVEAIITRTAPWSKVQNEWRSWRLDMERRNNLNATAIETLAETLQTSTDDRIRKSQIKAWIREFKALNAEKIEVPNLE